MATPAADQCNPRDPAEDDRWMPVSGMSRHDGARLPIGTIGSIPRLVSA